MVSNWMWFVNCLCIFISLRRCCKIKENHKHSSIFSWIQTESIKEYDELRLRLRNNNADGLVKKYSLNTLGCLWKTIRFFPSISNFIYSLHAFRHTHCKLYNMVLFCFFFRFECGSAQFELGCLEIKRRQKLYRKKVQKHRERENGSVCIKWAYISSLILLIEGKQECHEIMLIKYLYR